MSLGIQVHMVQNENVLITIGLIVVVVVAVATLLYVNLPQAPENNQPHESTEGQNQQNETEIPSENNTVLSVLYKGEYFNYTLEQLEEIETYTGSGRYIKTKLLPDTVVISESHNYTGIQMTTLLKRFERLPENYTITVTSNDGWTSTYTSDEIWGNVEVYNETGHLIENATATMILAYSEDGQYYKDIDPDNEIGPFRIAFVDDNVITPSDLWAKMVISIEIVTAT